mgnify:CR=1 FL=1
MWAWDWVLASDSVSATELVEEQREYVEIALQASNRLTTLLSDIQDLSRIEAGKMRI